jgi:hypothetical protein
MIARIKTQFHLPAERIEVKSDWHYQSKETPNGLATRPTQRREHPMRYRPGSPRGAPKMVLGEHPRALGESTFVAASYDQAKGLQDTPDLTINLDAHIDEPTANAQ